MSIVAVVIRLIVIGVLLWLEEAYIPLAAPIKTIIRAIVIIATVLWLLVVFGLLSSSEIHGQGIQPPQLTQEKFYAMLGQCQAQVSLSADYINTLNAELTAKDKEIEELKNPKKETQSSK